MTSLRRLTDRDPAITGLGLVTTLGPTLPDTWEAMGAGRRSLGPVAKAGEPFLRATVPEALESQAKFLNGAGRLAAEAAAQAVESARLEAAGHEPTSKGLYLAAIDLTIADFEGYHETFREATDGFRHAAAAETLNVVAQRKMSPFYLLETLNNNAFSFISAWHQLSGANTSLSGWGGPGALAVALAARAVSRGDASAVVACGAGRGTGAVIRLEFERLGMLPDGVPPGEGAGALVLEPLGDARARNARIQAVVAGSCATSGAGDRLVSAVRSAADAACDEAGVALRDVGSLWGPDAARDALGLHVATFDARRLTGEMGAGSELADVALAATSLARGALPDERPAGRTALVVTTGPEGQTVALVLAKAT